MPLSKQSVIPKSLKSLKSCFQAVAGRFQDASEQMGLYLDAKYPKTMKSVRSNTLAFTMYDRVSNPYIMAPVSLVAAFISPVPADSPIHFSNAYKHSRKVYRDLAGHFNGAHHRIKIDLHLEALRCLSEQTQENTYHYDDPDICAPHIEIKTI